MVFNSSICPCNCWTLILFWRLTFLCLQLKPFRLCAASLFKLDVYEGRVNARGLFVSQLLLLIECRTQTYFCIFNMFMIIQTCSFHHSWAPIYRKCFIFWIMLQIKHFPITHLCHSVFVQKLILYSVCSNFTVFQWFIKIMIICVCMHRW